METRPTDSREKSLPYVSKKLVRMKLPVQRLVIIHAAEELDQVPEFHAVSQSPLVTVDPEIVEQVKEELVEELAMVEMVKEAVIDEAEADAVEENIIEEESEVTTVGPSEDEVDFGDITEVAV